MRAAWLVLALWLGAILPAAAQEILVRTSVQPEGPVKLGQPVQLLVDVLFPDDMPHPARVTAPHVAGAQVFRFESQGTTMRERSGGTAYIGQRFEFDIYPRRAGTRAIPPVRVTLLDRAGDPVGERTGPAQSIQAVVPPGLDPSGPIVASTAVTLHETWLPEAGSFHVGDAVTRVLNRSAAGVPGLALAALAFPAPPGVRAYVDAPTINDQVERGEVTGRRTDRVTYVFEQPGSFVLPAVVQPWWDLKTGAAHTLTGAARHVTVAAAPASASASNARSPFLIPPAAWIAACLAAVLLSLFLARHRIATRWSRWRAAYADSERAAFRALRHATRGADPVLTYRAWQHWNAARPDRVMTPALAAAVGALERSLFSQGIPWNSAGARQLLVAARAAGARPRGRRHVVPLPPLNPDMRGSQ
jgi:hypothetical protein